MGSRLVIAVNLNADLFGRGTTIASHGSDANDDAEHAAAAQRRNGMLGMFSPEKLVKRQLVGAPGRPGIPTVMVDAFNVMQDRITRARLAGDPPDVLVSPRLSSIGWFDFHRAEDAIAAGTLATERALDSILEAAQALAMPTPTAATTGAPPK
jgi:NTE family protein